jgi:uncharacterized membrane protein
MNTRSANQTNQPENIELRMRTMRTLWLALFGTVFLYYMLTLFTGRSEDVTPNNTLSLILLALAVSATLVSFPVKHKLLKRAIEQRQVQGVQQAYIVGWAVNEVAALLGLFDFFRTANRYYYVPFLIAAIGQLFHYPRREHVEAAGFKQTGF